MGHRDSNRQVSSEHSTTQPVWETQLQLTLPIAPRKQNGHCGVPKPCTSYPYLSSGLVWVLATKLNTGISQCQPNLQNNNKIMQANVSLLCLADDDAKIKMILLKYFFTFLP